MTTELSILFGDTCREHGLDPVSCFGSKTFLREVVRPFAALHGLDAEELFLGLAEGEAAEAYYAWDGTPA